MSKESLRFSGTEIDKWKFCSSKSRIAIDDLDIDVVLISDKFACWEKGFK